MKENADLAEWIKALDTDGYPAEAIQALANAGGRAVAPLAVALHTARHVQPYENVIYALIRLGSHTMDELSVLLDDLRIYRGTIAFIIGAIGDPRGIDPLISMVDNASPWVRQDAIKALGAIGGPEVLPLLEKRMRDRSKYVKKAAQKAFEQVRQRSDSRAELRTTVHE